MTAAIPPLDERSKPGLSETLHFFPDPQQCQSCGAAGTLTHWRECDPFDKPTMVVVVLCDRCRKKLIDPHPRLYVPLQQFEPFPGVMEICFDCPMREGVSCNSPLAKHNGGSGMRIEGPTPTVAHFNFGGGRGRFAKWYRSKPTGCAGKQEALAPVSPDPLPENSP